MATWKIQREERVQNLNEADVREGNYVLYWMQSSQRAEQNHALEFAVQGATELDQHLLVVFGLTDDYPEANLRHYTFMLEGLKDVQEALEKHGIKMVVREGSPEEVALDAGKDTSLVTRTAVTCVRRRSGARRSPVRRDASSYRSSPTWSCPSSSPRISRSTRRGREVYGKVRYMSASGLARKAKPEQYVEKVEKRVGASG